MLSPGAQKLLMATSVATIVTCIWLYATNRSAVPNLYRSTASQSAKPTSDNNNTPHLGIASFLSASLKERPEAWNQSYGSQNRAFEIPYMGNYNCSDALCTEFIPSKKYYKCNRNGSNNGSCHFMNGSRRAPVALASFPGSGNTWVRGLLEQATGICTGAIYCDKSIRDSGFNGEGYRSGAVLVVKTHFLPWFTKKPVINDSIDSMVGPPWGSAIFIIRDPRDAIVSEWNRKTAAKYAKSSPAVKRNINSHVSNIGEALIGESSQCEKFIMKQLERWAALFEWVYYSKNLPVLVVKYEDIRADVINEMERMLNFLNVPFSREVLKKRMSEGFETFHRTHTKNYEHFTSKQTEYIHQQIEKALALLESKNNGDTLGIENYLHSTV